MTNPVLNLLTWVDFDDNGNETGATVMGRDGVCIALALPGPYRDEFTRRVVGVPYLLDGLLQIIARASAISSDSPEQVERGLNDIVRFASIALAKAKGE